MDEAQLKKEGVYQTFESLTRANKDFVNFGIGHL
jgi:hypothetical protein